MITKVKIKIKLKDTEFYEFIHFLNNAYSAIHQDTFQQIVICEALESFLMNAYKTEIDHKCNKTIMLNATQAYAIYTVATSFFSFATPYQGGIIMSIQKAIDSGFRQVISLRHCVPMSNFEMIDK